MRAFEFVIEGGWASAKTQGTTIFPTTLAQTVEKLKHFEQGLNQWLTQRGIPACRIGRPVGSGTYYQRDLTQQPTKEYGDIDVQFIVPELEGKTNAQISTLYYNEVAAFCASHPLYETENGKNVILELEPGAYIQVDLVLIYTDSVDWSAALAPEWNTKGVLSGSLFSALAAVLKISISSIGVQAKMRDGELVSFATQRGVELRTVSRDRRRWGIDVVRFFGGTEISPDLQECPGMRGTEVRIADIIATIQGIAHSLELSGVVPAPWTTAESLLQAVKASYEDKIRKTAESSKFDKAATPEAQARADKTKKMLLARGAEIAAAIIRGK